MQTRCKTSQVAPTLSIPASLGTSSSLAHLGSGVDILPAEHAVAEGSGGVVIDKLQHLEAGHASSLQHSSALSLIEEGWHGDHSILDGLLYRQDDTTGFPLASTLGEGFPVSA